MLAPLVLALGLGLDVLVVGPDGEPVAGEVVRLVEVAARYRGEPESVQDRLLDRMLAVSPLDRALARAVTDERGVARFDDVSRFVREGFEDPRFVLRLEIPPMVAHEQPIDLAPDVARVTLEKPPTGSLVFAFDADARGEVVLRGRSLHPWPAEHPCVAPIVDGEARFDEVGLGEKLEFEARLDGEEAPLAGIVAAPSRAGQEMRYDARLHARPVLIGRILTEDLTPARRVELGLSIQTRGRVSGARIYAVLTDAEGRFRFLLEERRPPASHRRLNFRTNRRSTIGRASSLLDFDEDPPAGPFDLGDVVLVSPGAELYLGRLSNDELESELALWTRRREGNGLYQREVEARWQEMARRSGGRWASFLAEQFDRRTEANWYYDLQLLTALRRAEGKPDPLAIVPEADFVDGTFPNFPVLACALTNVDVEGESFVLSDPDERGDSDRFGNLGVVVERAEGTPVPARELGGIPWGHSYVRPYPPGDSLRLTCRLADYVDLPGPGEYRVRLLYHPGHDIARDHDRRGWIVHESKPITVRVHARRVRLTRAELAEQRAWIRALPTAERPWVIEPRWRAELLPPRDPESAAGHLFAAGFEAVPALLDDLELTTDASEARRGWVLAMLWNVTGLNEPSDSRRASGVGPHRRISAWPPRESEPVGKRVSPELRERLVADWLELRPWFELELVD